MGQHDGETFNELEATAIIPFELQDSDQADRSTELQVAIKLEPDPSNPRQTRARITGTFNPPITCQQWNDQVVQVIEHGREAMLEFKGLGVLLNFAHALTANFKRTPDEERGGWATLRAEELFRPDPGPTSGGEEKTSGRGTTKRGQLRDIAGAVEILAMSRAMRSALERIKAEKAAETETELGPELEDFIRETSRSVAEAFEPVVSAGPELESLPENVAKACADAITGKLGPILERLREGDRVEHHGPEHYDCRSSLRDILACTETHFGKEPASYDRPIRMIDDICDFEIQFADGERRPWLKAEVPDSLETRRIIGRLFNQAGVALEPGPFYLKLWQGEGDEPDFVDDDDGFVLRFSGEDRERFEQALQDSVGEDPETAGDADGVSLFDQVLRDTGHEQDLRTSARNARYIETFRDRIMEAARDLNRETGLSADHLHIEWVSNRHGDNDPSSVSVGLLDV